MKKKVTKTKQNKKQSTFKMWFVPGLHNNHRPHIIKLRASMLVAIFLILLQVGYNFGTTGKLRILGYATNVSPGGVISLVNSQRSANGLGSLSVNSALTNAAYAKAQDMIANNYWSHYSPSGIGADYFISSSGYGYVRAGENLAKDWQSDGGIVNAWMGSSSHRANVLGDYTDIGIATVNGIINGEETTLVVAMFGQVYQAPPAPAPVVVEEQPPAPSADSPAPAQAEKVASSNSAPVTSSEQAGSSSQAGASTETAPAEQVAAATDSNITNAATASAKSETENQDGIKLEPVKLPGGNLSLISRIFLTLKPYSPAMITVLLVGLLSLIGLISHHKGWVHNIKSTGKVLSPKLHMKHATQVSILTVALYTVLALSVSGNIL